MKLNNVLKGEGNNQDWEVNQEMINVRVVNSRLYFISILFLFSLFFILF